MGPLLEMLQLLMSWTKIATSRRHQRRHQWEEQPVGGKYGLAATHSPVVRTEEGAGVCPPPSRAVLLRLMDRHLLAADMAGVGDVAHQDVQPPLPALEPVAPGPVSRARAVAPLPSPLPVVGLQMRGQDQ